MKIKKTLFVFFLLLSTASTAQTTVIDKYESMYTYYSSGLNIVNIDCTQPGGSYDCNQIYNPAIIANISNPSIVDPFNLGQIDHWGASHGSPNIDDGLAPHNTPFPGIHAAFMYHNRDANNIYWAEGLIGKLSPLTAGKEYALSYFKKVIASDLLNSTNEYDIYLMHCSDVAIYFTNTAPNVLPAPPPNSQRISCETNLTADNIWTQQSVCFTPNQDYDMIWVFPKINSATIRSGFVIGFAYPELIAKNDLSITIDSDPQDNCIKILHPSCTIKNAAYQWFLNGSLFSTQQSPTINTSTQYGTITLQVTLPAVATNSTCGNSCGVLNATVNVPICTPVWPKVYGYTPNAFGNSQPSSLVQDDFNNIFISIYSYDLSVNYNHNGGTYPTSPAISTIQYNKTTGVTNWIVPNERILFALNSGIVQLNINPVFYNTSVINTVYRNAVTGALVPGPASIPSNQIILADDNGTYITNNNNSLFVHSSSGVSAIPFPSSSPNFTLYKSQYNPATKHLFVVYSGMLAVYLLNNNTLTLINNPNASCGGGGTFVVNSLDEIFYTGFNNGSYGIYKYTYGNNNCTLFLSDCYLGQSYSPYVGDKILIRKSNDNNYFYYHNTITMEQKKIAYITAYTNVYPFEWHLFDGNDVYMYCGYELASIGNQVIPPVGPNGWPSIFITKFNVQSDFTFRPAPNNIAKKEPSGMNFVPQTISSGDKEKQAALSTVELLPNPVKNNLFVFLKGLDYKNIEVNKVSITNATGIVLLSKNLKDKNFMLDVSELKPGLYFLTITNKNSRIVKRFVKE